MKLLLALLLAAPGAAQRPAVPAAPPAPAAAPEAPARVARASVVAFEGYVEVERKEDGARHAVAALPARLAPGDRVITGRESRATLRFRDGSQVSLGVDTNFTVEAETLGATTLFLAAGKLWAAVNKSARRRFTVRTPAAVAAVRGTEFSVEVRGARDTAVEVFGGLVAVRGALGAESMVSALQRVDVTAGRMGQVERFQPRPESIPEAIRPAILGGERKGAEGPRAPGEGRSGEERRERGPGDLPPGGPGEGETRFAFDPARFKDFVANQAHEQMFRDRLEAQAAFEQKAQLYQEGKTLIDAFGRRVRVEEHILRPSADTFKFVSFNFRDNRTDFASVEVTANRALPERLADAGNLWFSPSAPSYWAVKQRLSMSNGADSVVELGVDGAPQLFTFAGQPIYDPDTKTYIQGSGSFYRTMFGNRYEFINGNAAAIADVFQGAFRPTNNGDVSGAGNALSGMMWRTQPVKVDITDGATSKGQYWTDAFVKYSGNDGLAYAQTTFQPSGGAAHFVSQRSYFNFRDTNSNGVLDFGEQDDPNNPGFFHDVVSRMDGTALAAVAGAGAKAASGDTLVFSDKNGTGAPAGNPQATISYGGGTAPLAQAMDFAQSNARDWLVADEFAIDDFGAVLPADGGFGDTASLFSGRNFERRLRSSRFSGDIDVVMSPAFIFQSGVSNAASQDRPVPSPGPKF